MKRNLTLLIGIFVIAVAALVVILIWPTNKATAPTTNGDGQATTTTNTTSDKAGISDLITVDAPLMNAQVSSPLTISGKARGNWYFEASFPVVLTDWDGKIIAEGHAQAQGDWMTEDFVPFTATLTFTTPTAGDPSVNRGTLILKNDNPSGDPARDKSVEIPVTFKK